jgi:hypothetical protein
MQGQYPGNRGVRPPGVLALHVEAASARLFLCAGCRLQVVICSCCDRGQIYCAGQRYQNGQTGRRGTPLDKVATGRAAKK